MQGHTNIHKELGFRVFGWVLLFIGGFAIGRITPLG